MSNTALMFVYMGIVMPLLGVFGYLTARRKRGAPGVRSFLIWYAFAIVFAVCALCGVLYPKLHWLYYLAGAMAVGNILVQSRGAYRARAQARDDSLRKW